MKGSVRIVVSTKKLCYELNLRRNITVIQGDSATGKTTLIQILSDYFSGRTGPGVQVHSVTWGTVIGLLGCFSFVSGMYKIVCKN